MREKLHLPRGCDGSLWLHRNKLGNHFMHCHEELEINLALRGRAAYLVKDRRYDLVPGALIWLFPDQEHLLIEQSPDFQMWIYVFRRPMVRRVCRPSAPVLFQRDPQGEFCGQLSEGRLRRLDALSHEVFEAQNDRPRFNAALSFAMLEFWAAMGSADQRPTLGHVHPAVEQAARLVHDAPARYSLDSLAAEVGLSPSRLSRVFRRQMGITLISYRQRRQLERFLDLFARAPEHKLMSLALQAGFGSYPQFHRVFRREMGRSPAQFLQNPD